MYDGYIVFQRLDLDLCILSDVFTRMLENPDVFFMLGSKIARMGLEKGRKRYRDYNDDDGNEEPESKLQKLY